MFFLEKKINPSNLLNWRLTCAEGSLPMQLPLDTITKERKKIKDNKVHWADIPGQEFPM